MKKLLFLLTVLFTVSLSNAQNVVTQMVPANGATDVNIDTHLTLTMSEDAVIGQQGFVSVYGQWVLQWTGTKSD